MRNSKHNDWNDWFDWNVFNRKRWSKFALQMSIVMFMPVAQIHAKEFIRKENRCVLHLDTSSTSLLLLLDFVFEIFGCVYMHMYNKCVSPSVVFVCTTRACTSPDELHTSKSILSVTFVLLSTFSFVLPCVSVRTWCCFSSPFLSLHTFLNRSRETYTRRERTRARDRECDGERMKKKHTNCAQSHSIENGI